MNQERMNQELDKRRDQAFEGMKLLYDTYVKYLLLSAVGAATVAGLAVTILEKSSTDPAMFDNYLTRMGIMCIPFLWISWAAGWAYLNVELWAHRHYLGYLETRIGEEGKPAFPGLNRDIIEREIYASRPQVWCLPSYHTILDVLVALFSIVLGAVSLVVGAVALKDGLRDCSSWLATGAAILYGVVVAVLYGAVFVIKVILSQRIRDALGSPG